ncbi:MAG: SDR family oxidoreductase [Aquamicrobium sp.]|uniref:SDR family NAD(P)-dependent oxidoreductase n=1 Tax=Aquamicrobium sp. TaxID=1872579 RepID=UPI00349EA9D8|nr:SDR family oxidoreductase [Aquamicrobium sp.]
MGDLVIVTGGASGIGAAVAALLRARGCRVVVFDLAPDQPGFAGWLRVDVSDEAAVEAALAKVEDGLGPVCGLVNAAGVLGKMHAPQRLQMSDWDREIAVDLRGTYLTCRAAGARMAARGAGSSSSTSPRSPAGMTSGPLHGYGPAKAAVISLTTTLAGEWGPRGVRVNAASPGFTRTEALEKGIEAGVLDPGTLSRPSALRRLVEPGEIAAAVAFLLGPEASGITGVNLPVDAGYLVGVTWQPYGGLRGG